MRFGRRACRNPGQWLALFLACAVSWFARAATEAGTSAGAAVDNVVVWDARERVIEPKFGQHSAPFEFTAFNASSSPVTIQEVRPNCGCTVAELPSSPWVLEPGHRGTIVGSIDFRGARGVFSKALFVTSTAGHQRLVVTVKVPVMDPATRRRNREIALADRQAVFRGECAACHLKPAEGLRGAKLFHAACGVCHVSPDRDEAVPDLLTAREHRDAAYWRKWINEGKAGTLMPAWSSAHGGPLTADEVDSLVDFALQNLPTRPRPVETGPRS